MVQTKRLSKKQRALEILARLKHLYPDATCSLDYETPVQLLVATILSAQCTDERVNKVTPELFRQFPDAAAIAGASREEIEALIRSTGFYRNKAKNIQGACSMIMEQFGGEVPQTMEELLTLPGVARKTANVVLANAFGINAGVTVDTHVKRLSNRLGLTNHSDPGRIERDLMKLLPQPDWENWSIRLIYHGRAACTARNPACDRCELADICPSVDTTKVDPLTLRQNPHGLHRGQYLAHQSPVKATRLGMSMVVAIALTLTLGLSSCTQSPEPPSQPTTPPIDTIEMPDSNAGETSDNATLQDDQLWSAHHRFSFDLLSTVLENRQDENTFVSPASVAIALAMAQNGAVGETQDAIASTLQMPDADGATVNRFYASMLEQFQPFDREGDVRLAIANALWGREDVTFKPTFLDAVESSFEAAINTLDFSNPDAIGTINGWVNDQTQGRIPSIIDTINPDDVLFLINAIYFKGAWTNAFDPTETSDRPFFLLDGTQKEHPLMTQTSRFRHLETDGMQAVQLPYGDDSRFQMVVWLPSPEMAWADFLNTLTADNWDTWLPQFTMREGTVVLPKFTLDDQMTLNDVLRSMGMAIAFDPNQANFSALSDIPTIISQVNHRTFLEVNEEGTEAAASTSVGVSVTSVEVPMEPFEMVVDRPFALTIYDSETEALLFLGTVTNP